LWHGDAPAQSRYDARVKYQTIKGTKDRLPSDAPAWRFITETARVVLERFGAGEIHTPVFEDTGVFHKAVGESSDIVRKEMYNFSDKGDRNLTLRPEATAPMVRAFLEHGFSSKPSPTKFWTFEPMFRAEKPQRGRERQFHQLGLEIIGLGDAFADAECIDAGWSLMNALGIKNYQIHLGSVGDPEDRLEFNTYLRDKLSPVLGRLSEDSKERLELNPMRILDSKSAGDQALLKELGVKPMLEFLGVAAKTHFEELQHYLREWQIPFVVDSSIVRGLDYYRRTAFEFIHNHESMRGCSTILAGGRYDGLAEMLGGLPTPGIGWGSGVERIVLALEAEGIPVPEFVKPLAYIVPLEVEALSKVGNVARVVRNVGQVLTAYKVKGVGKSLSDAEKFGAKFAVLIGQAEIANKTVSIRDMQTRDQVSIPIHDLEKWFLERR
jgi:histidyl-tRNA synthetase